MAMFKKRCRTHHWSTEVRLDTLHCLDCPATISVTRKAQLDRMRKTATAVRASRAANGGVSDAAVEAGRSLARKFFTSRGNHSEVHVREVTLAALCAVAFEQGREVRS